jgi:hypothetical protein
MGCRQRLRQSVERRPFGASQRRRTQMLNYLDRRQKHVPYAQLLPERLGQHHPLGGLRAGAVIPLSDRCQCFAAAHSK